MSNQEHVSTDQVVSAIHNVPYEDTLAWSDLSSLSGNTQVESIEVFSDEIRFSGDNFEGPVVWHVTLNYGGSDDSVRMSETFPGKVRGHIENGSAHVDELSVDVSSFYE